MPINVVSSTTPTTHSSNTARSSELNADTFMKIFTSQIANQNPMEPMDSSDFLNQFAQVTSVQSLAELKETLTGFSQSFSTLSDAGNLSQATSLLGRNVSYFDAAGTQQQGIVEAIRIDAGGPQLVVAGQSVGLGAVQQVTLPPA